MTWDYHLPGPLPRLRGSLSHSAKEGEQDGVWALVGVIKTWVSAGFRIAGVLVVVRAFGPGVNARPESRSAMLPSGALQVVFVLLRSGVVEGGSCRGVPGACGEEFHGFVLGDVAVVFEKLAAAAVQEAEFVEQKVDYHSPFALTSGYGAGVWVPDEFFPGDLIEVEGNFGEEALQKSVGVFFGEQGFHQDFGDDELSDGPRGGAAAATGAFVDTEEPGFCRPVRTGSRSGDISKMAVQRSLR